MDYQALLTLNAPIPIKIIFFFSCFLVVPQGFTKIKVSMEVPQWRMKIKIYINLLSQETEMFGVVQVKTNKTSR